VPSTKDMQMKVVYRLSSIIARVDDDTVALIEMLSTSDLGGRSHQVSEQRSMLGKSLRLRSDVLFRNDKKMSGSLRINIRKAYTKLILIDPIGRNSTGNDSAKQTIIRHGRILLSGHFVII
jgi:hypothetical protein